MDKGSVQNWAKCHFSLQAVLQTQWQRNTCHKTRSINMVRSRSSTAVLLSLRSQCTSALSSGSTRPQHHSEIIFGSTAAKAAKQASCITFEHLHVLFLRCLRRIKTEGFFLCFFAQILRGEHKILTPCCVEDEDIVFSLKKRKSKREQKWGFGCARVVCVLLSCQEGNCHGCKQTNKAKKKKTHWRNTRGVL